MGDENEMAKIGPGKFLGCAGREFFVWIVKNCGVGGFWGNIACGADGFALCSAHK